MGASMDSSSNTEASSEAKAALIPKELIAVERKNRSEIRRSWNRFKRFRPALVGLVIISFLAIVAIVPMVFEPYSYTATNPSRGGEGSSLEHPFGLDRLGRDMLSRMIRGTRIAFLVAFAATTISLVIGVTIGAAAGYFGGWVDTILSRFVDTIMAFPTLVLLITLAAVLGPSIQTTVIVIGATIWSTYARVVRADVLSIRERDFVLAARAIGANDSRIIRRHVLPNVLGPVIVIASLSVGGVIILEAALSFLGLGVTPPTPSWGGMLSDGRAYIRAYPHIAIYPGVAIFITVLAFNMVGDGLRDALDPRQRE